MKIITFFEFILRDYSYRTLWVKSINNAVEECQISEKAIQADKAMFTVTGKTNLSEFLLVNRYSFFFLKRINVIQKQLLHVFFLLYKKLKI